MHYIPHSLHEKLLIQFTRYFILLQCSLRINTFRESKENFYTVPRNMLSTDCLKLSFSMMTVIDRYLVERRKVSVHIEPMGWSVQWLYTDTAAALYLWPILCLSVSEFITCLSGFSFSTVFIPSISLILDVLALSFFLTATLTVSK